MGNPQSKNKNLAERISNIYNHFENKPCFHFSFLRLLCQNEAEFCLITTVVLKYSFSLHDLSYEIDVLMQKIKNIKREKCWKKFCC